MAYSRLPEGLSEVPAVKDGQAEIMGVSRRDNGSCRVAGDPAAFVVSLERELARMRRYGDSACLLFASADASVDPVSVDSLTGRVAANLRSYDALCRYGANHFLILLPHVKGVDVPGIVRRVRIQMAGYALILADGAEGFVTASTGGVMLDPDVGMQENIDRAAGAFRLARRDGGNHHRMWAPNVETVQAALPARQDA